MVYIKVLCHKYDAVSPLMKKVRKCHFFRRKCGTQRPFSDFVIKSDAWGPPMKNTLHLKKKWCIQQHYVTIMIRYHPLWKNDVFLIFNGVHKGELSRLWYGITPYEKTHFFSFFSAKVRYSKTVFGFCHKKWCTRTPYE